MYRSLNVLAVLALALIGCGSESPGPVEPVPETPAVVLEFPSGWTEQDGQMSSLTVDSVEYAVASTRTVVELPTWDIVSVVYSLWVVAPEGCYPVCPEDSGYTSGRDYGVANGWYVRRSYRTVPSVTTWRTGCSK
jgi:hypothetical protein